MIEVRRISGDEGGLLRQVRLAALADAPSAFGSRFERESQLTPQDWARRAREGSAGSDRATFFAVADGGVVGLVGGYRPDPTWPGVELISMWTDPAVRRTGVGRILIGAVLDWARAAGAPTVELWVTRGNETAENLYRSMGFVETGDHQPLPSDPCRDERRMRLVL